MKDLFKIDNTPGNINFLSFLPKNFLDQETPQDSERLPEILFLTSFPPRQCGIATYSEDLIKALQNQFVQSFAIEVCALETNKDSHDYQGKAKYILNTSETSSYDSLAQKINADPNIKILLIQHEFGLFSETTARFNQFVSEVNKPVVFVFHTVLPRPDDVFKKNVQHLLDESAGIIVMTQGASDILCRDYVVDSEKIAVIPHGTHLVPHLDKDDLKVKYGLTGRTILSTFGLLSSGKSIETTLDALPAIVKTTPNVLFLIIGKTHPTVVLHEGEAYREQLQQKIAELNLENHVRFVNKYLPLDELLEYLQLTDIYVFSSKDPNQAVSGTFSYALSCGCPVVSTPIPHAREVLSDNSGMLFDFGNSDQLADAVNRLLFDVELRQNIVVNGLHKITCTSWENSAVAHARFLSKVCNNEIKLHYRNPELNLSHIKKMTTDFGILQFSRINQPDISSGYTIDDNARALIAMCMHYKKTGEDTDLRYIKIYLDFIAYCERPKQLFINYVDYNCNFTTQNQNENLEDSTGRTIWALGYLTSLSHILPGSMIHKATQILNRVLPLAEEIHSPRAIGFILKGLYYMSRSAVSIDDNLLITLADRLVNLYKNESTDDWQWFENYLTYANSVLPEALLCAYAVTGNTTYKKIAKESFDFLLSKTFTDSSICVVSNKTWHTKGQPTARFGEQPIDVAYTVMALRKFHDIFKDKEYIEKMEMAFNWFLGNNHLQQVIYNPCTGGCFDGLEESNVNLNQGAESTVSYLMARLMSSKFFGNEVNVYSRRRSRIANLA